MCSEGVVSVIFHVMMENKQGVMARKDIDLPIAYASTALCKAELQCSPMEHGFSLISIPANVSPWRLILEEYDYGIWYIPGKINKNADTVSRIKFNH